MIGADPAFAQWVPDFLREQRLPASYAATIETLHAPLAGAIADAAHASDGLLVVGLCGPQGSGKSTLCDGLVRLLNAGGLRAALLSLDDLYLTRAERAVLARDVHPLLATRGPPGTHDIALGCELIDAIRRGDSVRLPRFDKARDDRRPADDRATLDRPIDVLLFEGWCVGALPAAEIEPPINKLEREEDAEGIWRRFVNQALAAAYPPLSDRIDALVMLAAPGWGVIAGWREEQEAKLRTSRGGAAARVMSPAQIGRFVQHYERVTRAISAEMPGRADVVVRLDDQRRPLSITAAPGGRLTIRRPARAAHP